MFVATHFNSAYQLLNEAQRRAVDLIEGPVMVLAGPGTGKTQVLAARVANILLKTDTNPSSVLALTFTESAAKNMRERLVQMIGKTGYYVQIQTFHGFCTEVINSYPEYFAIERDSLPVSELERYTIIEEILKELSLTAIKPMNTPFFYVRDIVGTISDLKREGISAASFQKIVDDDTQWLETNRAELKKAELTRVEKRVSKNKELIQVYEVYQRKLRDQKRFDFDDMIALVVEAFQEHEELLLEYQERLQYFLVDEYQDTNTAQNTVVDLLASYWGEQANIFVVGDPNQAIYRFQGASLENVLSFTQRYPQAEVINLEVGYRSVQKIYDAAATLIAQNQNTVALGLPDVSRPLRSVKEKGESLKVFAAPSQTLETVYIAEAIQALLNEGVNPAEIAVLYRTNAESAELSVALSKWGIRYEIDGGENVLQAPHIVELLTLFQVIKDIKNSEEDEHVFAVLQYPWLQTKFAISPLVTMKLARGASKAGVTLFEFIQSGATHFKKYQATQNLTPLELEPVIKWAESMTVWAAREAQQTLSTWFEMVIQESGFLEWLQTQDTKIELLNQLNSLFREVKALSSGQREYKLAQLLTAIETLNEHRLPITTEDLNIQQAAVRLSTVHKAKGQEWAHVFVTRCVDGKWGNSINRELLPLPPGILKNTDLSQKERNEDDRRLFYVALTRAKMTLTLTYPETLITDNRSKSVVPSVFIEELKDHLVPVQTELAAHVITNADDHLARLLAPVALIEPTVEERQFLETLVVDYKLSVSALNTYLRSPAEFVAQHLLRVPRARQIHEAFGTAVHAALEKWYSIVKDEGQAPPLETVLKEFKQALEKEDITLEDLAVRLTYGQKVLTDYYHAHQGEVVKPVFVERFFGSGWSRAQLGDIHLVGRIDRIDLLDAAHKTARVIDYKTGRARTLGEIAGTTQSVILSEREQALPAEIRAPLQRQLVFYKLLTELDRTFPLTVVEGCFEFIEPDKNSGKLVTRKVDLSQTAVDALKELIVQVMSEIRNLQFLEPQPIANS